MRKTLPALAALLLLAKGAAADIENSGADYTPSKATHRAYFALGSSFAGTFATANGYPNDAAKIGLARYHASTGDAGGLTNTLWVGGALRDWLVFGIGGAVTTVAGSGTLSQGGAIMFHLEGFPLFDRGGVFRDLGLVGDFGVGGRKINYASAEVANGGSMSFVALGLLYEPLSFGKHFRWGPILQFAEQFSDTMNATMVIGGFQVAYYSGP
ncbi:MAG TPA: hypothetical protein VHC69_22685 [Polyangiaceae bacterium]|nr:hypothetical protein [Polyangiaceae bacterium]